MLQRFNSSNYPAPCVSIASTTLELLEWIKTVTGKGIIKSKKNYNIDKHKTCYSYILKDDDAINFIKEIYPYLIIENKKLRAKLILEKYKSLTPRNGRYNNDMIRAKEEFYYNFINIK